MTPTEKDLTEEGQAPEDKRIPIGPFDV